MKQLLDSIFALGIPEALASTLGKKGIQTILDLYLQRRRVLRLGYQNFGKVKLEIVQKQLKKRGLPRLESGPPIFGEIHPKIREAAYLVDVECDSEDFLFLIFLNQLLEQFGKPSDVHDLVGIFRIASGK